MSDATTPDESVNPSEERTIVDCAVRALKALGKPSTVQEIYDYICAHSEYQFNTSVPSHVLRTSIRRHTIGAGRADMAHALLFEETENETYRLVNTATKKRGQPGMRRIHRAKDKEEIIQSLTHESTGAFKEIWRLLLFAAVLGFKLGKREALAEVDTGRGIDQSSFGNSPSWPGILYLIGLVENSTTDLLASSEEAESARIQMFEEYANGGLSVLKERCGDAAAGFDFLVGFVSDHLNADSAPQPDLTIAI